jgi:hypothetical protein
LLKREEDVTNGQGAAESSRRDPVIRRFTDQTVKLRDMIKQIPAAEWDLFNAVLPPTSRQRLHSVRAAATAQTHREKDDRVVLMRIGSLRPGEQGLTIAGAVSKVLADLPTNGGTLSGYDILIFPDGRRVSRNSAQKHLERKYKKHQREIMRCVDSVALGQRLAERYLSPVSALLDGVAAITRHRMVRESTSEMPRAALESAASLCQRVSLTEAADVIFRRAKELATRPRSG